MKSNNTIIIVGLAALAFFVFTSASSNADNAQTDMFDFTQLDNEPDDLARINNLYSVLIQQGLTNLQIQLILAQLFYETGILNTSGTNYTAIDQLNNWGGIGGSGALRSYPDLQSFFNDYLRILRMGADPLDATDTYDFVTKLAKNSYFGANPTLAQQQTYLTGINNIFHQLYIASGGQ